MYKSTTLDDIREHLEKGNILGLPIEELQVLEQIKDYCFPTMGPLVVGIDMNIEMFLLKKDRKPTGSRWY